MECLFCKIIAGEIPSSKVYEDDDVYAFHDISPQAPTHFLVIPKEHISSLNELDDHHEALMGKMVMAARKIAKELGIDENGYRVVTNCGNDGGQTVGHIHFHVLGGRNLNWPPG